MDTIKTLMDKREYDLVIKITENSKDPDSLFYRISALLGIGKGDKALETLKENREILKKNLYLLIKVHIDLLIILNKFDEAHYILKLLDHMLNKDSTNNSSRMLCECGKC